MRIAIFIGLAIVAMVAGAVTFLPMSMAADMVARQVPDFRFSNASGSVWDGKLTNVSYGEQTLGDLSVKTDLLALFGGKAAGTVGMARQGFAGQADVSYGIGIGGLDVKDLSIAGDIAVVPGMPPSIVRSDGKFTQAVKGVKFANTLCESASGEVWTDALTKVNYKGWVGPELRGPVTCAGGKLQVEASGTAATGENVLATMIIGQHLDMEMTASVANAGPGATEALTSIGFELQGDKLVLRQQLASQ